MGEELRYATMLVHCGELQIKYVDMDTTFTGSLIEKNGQYIIILNARMSAEFNFKKLLHEVKHLKHINNRLDKYMCEKEAIAFEDINYSNIKDFID